MALTYHSVKVQVGEGILWIGEEAYPLRGITHVAQRRLVVNKAEAWKTFLTRALISLLLGGIVAAIVGTIGTILLFAILAFLIWRLVSTLGVPPVYGLVIGTAGIQRNAVWGTEKREIDHLVAEITKAIGRPDVAQMTYHVTHAVHGDSITMYGDGSIGKAMHSGTGNNLAGG